MKVNATADIRTLTVTVSHGTLSQEAMDGASITDATHRSATWFWRGKTTEEVREILSQKEFTYEAGIEVQIFIDGNENIKVDSLPSNAKLTQYTNGHYYLFIYSNKYKSSKAYGKCCCLAYCGESGNNL